MNMAQAMEKQIFERELESHSTKDPSQGVGGYKPSGIQWLGDIPEHWEVKKGKLLFEKLERPLEEGYETITCFRDGTVTLRKNRRLRGFTESLKEIGYQGVHKYDLVIHGMDAFAGAIGVSDSTGKSSPVYLVCKSRNHEDPFFYAYP